MYVDDEVPGFEVGVGDDFHGARDRELEPMMQAGALGKIREIGIGVSVYMLRSRILRHRLYRHHPGLTIRLQAQFQLEIMKKFAAKPTNAISMLRLNIPNLLCDHILRGQSLIEFLYVR